MDTPEADQARWFAEEVQPHESAVRSYLSRRFPGLTDVDDVLQDSYVRILRAHRSGTIVSARNYLFSVARNAALAVFRYRGGREIAVNDLDDSPLYSSDAEVYREIGAAEEVRLAAEAMDRLPRRCREIIMLRILEGLTHREIAERLGLSEPTVRVQVMRGMRRCTELLKRRGVVPPRDPGHG
jgi:RNA polymerase sigma factor (sigma-70 family)